jgi:hypothetical protein
MNDGPIDYDAIALQAETVIASYDTHNRYPIYASLTNFYGDAYHTTDLGKIMAFVSQPRTPVDFPTIIGAYIVQPVCPSCLVAACRCVLLYSLASTPEVTAFFTECRIKDILQIIEAPCRSFQYGLLEEDDESIPDATPDQRYEIRAVLLYALKNYIAHTEISKPPELIALMGKWLRRSTGTLFQDLDGNPSKAFSVLLSVISIFCNLFFESIPGKYLPDYFSCAVLCAVTNLGDSAISALQILCVFCEYDLATFVSEVRANDFLYEVASKNIRRDYLAPSGVPSDEPSFLTESNAVAALKFVAFVGTTSDPFLTYLVMTDLPVDAIRWAWENKTMTQTVMVEFAVMCKWLIGTSVDNCDFAWRLHETGLLEILFNLTVEQAFPVEKTAMQSIVLSFPKFNPEIIQSLIQRGFIESFAGLCPSIELPVESVRVLGLILEWIQNFEPEERVRLTNLIQDFGLLKEIDSFAPEVDPAIFEAVQSIWRGIVDECGNDDVNCF